MKSITVPIFDVRLYMTTNPEDIRRWSDETPETASGIVLEAPHGVIIAMFDDNPKHLVHECVHAACCILSATGVKVSTDDHEILARLTDWIYDQWHRKMNN